MSTTTYLARHNKAVLNPQDGFEDAVVSLAHGLVAYATAHQARYGSPVSEDYVLGPAHEAIAEGLRTLLDGELGRLDAGSLDALILPFIARGDQ